MKIGIIGSGIVGQVLARSLNSEGHSVMLGTRDTTKPEVVEFAAKNPFITTGTFEEAAIFGELLVLATAGTAVENAIALAGPLHFSAKTVIDTTNPISGAEPVNGVLGYFTKADESLMERIQKLIPDARVVKAFNSVGNAFMYKPQFEGGPPTMFICGNNEAAKKTVTEILTAFGWETEDMGKIEAARAIEPLCILWCIPGFIRNEWSHAFKLLKK
ncbi:MAG TPA: NAD(P)-binding domain-containing protein [Chitinophagaceae bacterium]|nr:NAD(P)-binding domain-containing protein [Chitinophagaceae bacterium]